MSTQPDFESMLRQLTEGSSNSDPFALQTQGTVDKDRSFDMLDDDEDEYDMPDQVDQVDQADDLRRAEDEDKFADGLSNEEGFEGFADILRNALKNAVNSSSNADIYAEAQRTGMHVDHVAPESDELRLVEPESYAELTGGLDDIIENYAGQLMMDASAVKFDSPKQAYDIYKEMKVFLASVYDSGLHEHVDVPVVLMKEYPDHVVYTEALSIVKTYEVMFRG